MAERKRSRGPGDDDPPGKRPRAAEPSIEVVVLEDDSSEGEWVEPAPGPADGGATPPPVGVIREVFRGLYRGGCLIQGEPAPGVQEALVDIPDVQEVGPPAPDVPLALVEVPDVPPADLPGEPAPGVQLDLVEVPAEPQLVEVPAEPQIPPVAGPVNARPNLLPEPARTRYYIGQMRRHRKEKNQRERLQRERRAKRG